jgi:hypothetical protein
MRQVVRTSVGSPLRVDHSPQPAARGEAKAPPHPRLRRGLSPRGRGARQYGRCAAGAIPRPGAVHESRDSAGLAIPVANPVRLPVAAPVLPRLPLGQEPPPLELPPWWALPRHQMVAMAEPGFCLAEPKHGKAWKPFQGFHVSEMPARTP